MPSRAARKAAIVDGEEGDYEEEEEEEIAIAGNEMVTPGVAKLVSYGIRTEVPMLELPAPPDWDAGASDDEAAAKDDADAAEDDESDSDLEIAVTTKRKKKPLGARNTAPAPASPGGKHSAGKRRKEVRTKETRATRTTTRCWTSPPRKRRGRRLDSLRLSTSTMSETPLLLAFENTKRDALRVDLRNEWRTEAAATLSSDVLSQQEKTSRNCAADASPVC